MPAATGLNILIIMTPLHNIIISHMSLWFKLIVLNFVTSAVSAIIAHSAIMAASASTSCSVISVTCVNATYST